MSTSATHNTIMEAGGKDRAPILVVTYPEALPDGDNLGRKVETKLETYSFVNENIKKKTDVEAEAGENINKQDVETNLYWAFGKFTSWNGKEIARALSPPAKFETKTINDAEDTPRDKEIDKLMTLISTSFKRICNPTNKNLKTSSNTRNKNVESTLRIRHTSREFRSAKKVKDSSYHKDKMLLCKQEEAWVQLTSEAQEWVHDSDEETIDQDLEAHYLYMAKIQEVIPVADEGTRLIFDKEPLE
ncbi:hypothetical protein Tco_1003635 [Tanacetum coccineum]|uniref:Uncharacterized protein n=1 Tax=Tanacetum coccineum TaxID=301880 RepID=A0ABQ5FBI2_9ASTR